MPEIHPMPSFDPVRAHAQRCARRQAAEIEASLRRYLASGFRLDELSIEWERTYAGFKPSVTLRRAASPQA